MHTCIREDFKFYKQLSRSLTQVKAVTNNQDAFATDARILVMGTNLKRRQASIDKTMHEFNWIRRLSDSRLDEPCFAIRGF